MKKTILTIVLAVLAFGSLPAQAAQSGSIVAWGLNNHGQCDVPAPNSGFIAIAAGWYHSLGLKEDGSVAAWGSNSYGQCNVPAPNSGFIAIAAGRFHSLGLKEDGSVAAWGLNSNGQCDVPAPNSAFIAIAAGYYHSLGLKEDGSVVAWGWNSSGQLNVPAPNSGFIAIAGGYEHSLALKEDGSVVGWGNNYHDQATPPGGNDYVAIATGSHHSLALKQDGSIVGWGWNRDGQAMPPVGNDYAAVAAGEVHSLALKQDGSIVGWGSNISGFYGNWIGQATPPAGNDYVAVAAGYYHSLAIVGEPPTPPIADAGSDQTVTDFDDNGSEQVTLDGSGSSDSDGTIVSWVWTDNLGDTILDGEITTAALSVGTHSITLTVTDDNGLSDTDTVTIMVEPFPNEPPVADADGPYTIYAGDTLTLDASGSNDPDNNIISYIWDLDDDGIFETDAGEQAIFDVNYAYLESLGFVPGDPYDIHVQVTDSKGLSDTAVSTLTIPAISLLNPNGGETLVGSETYTINWSSDGGVGSVVVEYSIDNGQNWSNITTTEDTGSYEWLVPAVMSSQCLVRITSVMHPSVYDVSDDVFQIYDPVLSLIKPNGGEAILKGDTFQIIWSSGLLPGDVIIEYSTDNGQNWGSLTTTEDTGSYQWQVNTPASNQYLLRITDADGTGH